MQSPILPHIPFFHTITPEISRFIEAKTRLKKLKKGESLAVQGDPVEHFYIVMEGCIVCAKEMLDGHESVSHVLVPHDVIGEAFIMVSGVYPYHITAAEPALVLAIPHKVLHEAMREFPIFTMLLLKSMALCLQKAELAREHLESMNAPQRIACFLIQQAGGKTEGSATFPLPYDKAIIAAQLGMQPESFSRALKALQKVGVHSKKSEMQIDDMRALLEFTCVSCSGMESMECGEAVECSNTSCAVHGTCHKEKH
jgi:CRP-like cAMP-binding protein